MKSLVAGFRGRSFGASVSMALVAMLALVAGPASAAGGIADGVVSTITAANADVVLIGIAILALVVLIASISWFKRATNK